MVAWIEFIIGFILGIAICVIFPQIPKSLEKAKDMKMDGSNLLSDKGSKK